MNYLRTYHIAKKECAHMTTCIPFPNKWARGFKTMDMAGRGQKKAGTDYQAFIPTAEKQHRPYVASSICHIDVSTEIRYTWKCRVAYRCHKKKTTLEKPWQCEILNEQRHLGLTDVFNKPIEPPKPYQGMSHQAEPIIFGNEAVVKTTGGKFVKWMSESKNRKTTNICDIIAAKIAKLE